MILPLLTLLATIAPSVVKIFSDDKSDATIIDKVKSALGIQNMSTEEFITKLSSDQELKNKLMALEYDYKIKLAEIEVKDRDSARLLFKEGNVWRNPQFIMAIIGMFFIVLLVALIAILEVYGKDIGILKDITFFLCGTIVPAIFNFFFGDSHSSSISKKIGKRQV